MLACTDSHSGYLPWLGDRPRWLRLETAGNGQSGGARQGRGRERESEGKRREGKVIQPTGPKHDEGLRG